ncbi:MAG: pilin [Candidatus Komeilibacteria bacterium]
MISLFISWWSHLVISTAQAAGPVESVRQNVFASAGIKFTSYLGLGQNCSSIPDGTFLACYISSLYVFFVRAAVILAVLMIIIGGLRWLLAVGDAGKIKESKDIVIGAITGLVLALISWVLFAQINSQLVNLKSIDIQVVTIPSQITIGQEGTGYCKRTGEQPSLKKIIRVSSLWNADQQMATFHPSLVKVMNNMESNLKSWWGNVGLSSVTDGNIFSVSAGKKLCHRDEVEGDLLGSCQHSDSFHYGGPANKCKFDAAYPPVSCAVDLTIAPATLYVALEDVMKQSGFDYIQCENGPGDKVPCFGIEGITHIHGEIFGLPNPDKPDKPYCYSVVNQE